MYKDNWQIERSFKMIKQKLKIESFIGTKPNAVMIQILTALIAILSIYSIDLSLGGRYHSHTGIYRSG